MIGHQATQIAFKNCAPFTKCITKIDGTTIDDAEDYQTKLAKLGANVFNKVLLNAGKC